MPPTPAPQRDVVVSGIVYVKYPGEPAEICDFGCFLTFEGTEGWSYFAEADSSGRYSVTMSPGTYYVEDWTFDQDWCGMPPVVTPATIVVSGGSMTINFTTTGCIVF
ncbi:MAG: hypothetical protein M9925_01990 [Chloroflexi bacterium]|nr:hypothetical protein [Chloroflexota bacterium]MCZ7575955.1 hypothetical protein [Dehalococcoidia bacterium]NJD64544.1 hypothetical protein [Chloroflexota bacterium]